VLSKPIPQANKQDSQRSTKSIPFQFIDHLAELMSKVFYCFNGFCILL
jgi:hypothetical protein